MFCLMQLFVQPRQFGARLLRLGLQAEHFIRCCLTDSHAFMGQAQLLVLCTHDSGGGFQLRGEACTGDGRGPDDRSGGELRLRLVMKDS